MVRTDGCQCYVKTLGAEAMLSLRYGAHSLSCPVYRESRDPVDRLNDDATRAYYNGLAVSPAPWHFQGPHVSYHKH